jgi:hypothetical protein
MIGLRQHVREAWKSPRFERLISGSGCSSVRLLLSWPKNVGPYTARSNDSNWHR